MRSDGSCIASPKGHCCVPTQRNTTGRITINLMKWSPSTATASRRPKPERPPVRRGGARSHTFAHRLASCDGCGGHACSRACRPIHVSPTISRFFYPSLSAPTPRCQYVNQAVMNTRGLIALSIVALSSDVTPSLAPDPRTTASRTAAEPRASSSIGQRGAMSLLTVRPIAQAADFTSTEFLPARRASSLGTRPRWDTARRRLPLDGGRFAEYRSARAATCSST